MNWFFSKSDKKKGKTSTKTRAAKPKREAWDPKRTLHGLRWCAIVLAVVGSIYAFYASEPYLRAYAARQAEVKTVSIELRNLPGWLQHSEQVLDDIQSTVASNISSDPLNASDLINAQHALRANPWVKDVTRIERASAGLVVVHATYRAPAAVVAAKDGYHLIDEEGVRLLDKPYSPAQAPRISEPVIVTAASSVQLPATALCGVGEVWPGEHVQAALKLIKLLRNQPYFDQIKAFDVSGQVQSYDATAKARINKPYLVLHTDHNTTLHWGLAPGEERSTEISLSTKLAAMKELYERHGNKLGIPNKRVDIYSESILLRASNQRPEF